MNLFDYPFRFTPVWEPIQEPKKPPEEKTVRRKVTVLRPCMNGTFVETVETCREEPVTTPKEYQYRYFEI